jgi:restriction system protein
LSIDNEPPWNPRDPLEISPTEYEKQVVAWLKDAGANLEKFKIQHNKNVAGKSGEYSLDGWAEFETFGVKFSILIECKRHSRPVNRDVVLGVNSKLQEVRSQKAIIFSTSGFQRGAIKYASDNRIALITFIDGRLTYQTRSAESPSAMSYPTDLTKYAGQMVSSVGNITTVSSIDDEHLSPLTDWLINNAVDQGKEIAQNLQPISKSDE